jgi:hypothetical protein
LEILNKFEPEYSASGEGRCREQRRIKQRRRKRNSANHGFSRAYRSTAHSSGGGMMKKAKITKEKKARIVNFDAIDWFLAIDGCLA